MSDEFIFYSGEGQNLGQKEATPKVEVISEEVKEEVPTSENPLLVKYQEESKKLNELHKNRLITNISKDDPYWEQLKIVQSCLAAYEEGKKV